ncbi:MAG TPA: hypothetical protein VFU13_20010 [Steroidobacteraceae bacterium]|nr:hypothetical protein [Steroidobacteraceae bacterium]
MSTCRGLKTWVAVASIFIGVPALARDRPGTPNEGSAWHCASTLLEEPAVCVRFRNTATEDVGFLMNWTENGQLQSSDVHMRADCIRHSAQHYSCNALRQWFSGNTNVEPADRLSELINPSPDGRFISDREFPEGFRVKGLAHDTEYCFRFRAIDRFAVISAHWSGYTCVRTPPAPPEPLAPQAPKVTGLQPTSGLGVEGDGQLFRILVEWHKSAEEELRAVGWYTIQYGDGKNWSEMQEKYFPSKYASRRNFEGFVDSPHASDPTQRQAVRVCAWNPVHTTCSPATWYYPFAAPRDRLKPDVERPNSLLSGKPKTNYASNTAPQAAERAPVYSSTAAISSADLDALAARGAGIAAHDPLSAELRNRAAEGAGKRGFDIGMAATEGQTQDGPGKKRIHDALSAAEQEGYDIAVSFSLQRNKNAERAAVGAAIANGDPAIAAARAREPDVFYWLGFDIASGIFGDPAAGAQGNTATGPGSLGIRDALSPAAQRGFNASVALHLGRKYR